MKTGDTIRIGPLIYSIRLVERLEDDNREPLNGRIRHDDCEILIAADISPQVQRVVLWHEVLHGILHSQGEGDDEAFVDMLAHEIARVLQDNPMLAEASP